MRLSLKLLALGITKGNVHIVSTRNARPDQMRLKSIMLWEQNAQPDYTACYVVRAEDLSPDFRCPEEIAMIISGTPDPDVYSGINADIMIWDCAGLDISFEEQFNTLTSIFLYFQNAELQLYMRMANNATLEELVSYAEVIFRNPILMLDASFSLLTKSRVHNPLDWEIPTHLQVPSLSAETIDQIRISKAYRERDQHGGIFYLSNEILDCGALLIQMRQDQRTFYVAILETDQPLTLAHHQLLQYFAGFAAQVLHSRRVSSAKITHFEDFLERLLLNEKIDPHEINRQLQSVQWRATDHCVCFVLDLDQWNRKDNDFYGICRMVENKFPCTVSFLHNDRVVCLTNLDQAGIGRDVLLQLLAPFVRDQLFHAGISFEMFDFSALPNYHQQALAALDFGRRTSPDEWCYRFEKYALDYFTQYGTSRMEGRYLCHPDLITLAVFDKENNTELLNTLRSYLTHGQNATVTAADLFIHRNTLYQRLNRIEALISASLANPSTRLYMQLSYSIMDFNALNEA